MNILLAILVGWTFNKVQFMISVYNYGVLYNGFGVIDMVNKKKIQAPMAYRVLVPWLVGLIEKLFKIKPEDRIVVYETIKMILVMFAFWSIAHVFGITIMLLSVALLLATIEYDYWDWPVELAAIVLAIGGCFWVLIPVIVLHALSRETAPIVPLAYYLATGIIGNSIILMVLAVGTMMFVRILIGKRDLYCERFMHKKNWELLKNFGKWKPIYLSRIFVSIVLTLLTILAIIVSPKIGMIPGALLVAGWLLAKVDEPRVFSACIPFIALMIGGGL